jgi:hypothetical protein
MQMTHLRYGKQEKQDAFSLDIPLIPAEMHPIFVGFILEDASNSEKCILILQKSYFLCPL